MIFACCFFSSVSAIDETLIESKLLELADETELETAALNILNVDVQKLYSTRQINDITAALLIPTEETPDEPILIAGSKNVLLQRTNSNCDNIRLKLLDDYKGIKRIYNLENDM